MSDDDVIAICRVAAENGLTLGELLGDFIGNLIGGTRRRGADEQDLARDYVDRNLYTVGLSQSYLMWLLRYNYDVEEIVDVFEHYLDAVEDNDDPDWIEDLFNQVNGPYNEYVAEVRKAQSFDDAHKGVVDYTNRRSFYLAGKDPDVELIQEEETQE
jgi:hypothetical protein